MKEIADILGNWRQCVADGRDAVLATVVAVEGSSYRRPGARMLIPGDGLTIGAISGGCIERDVIYRAGPIAAGAPPVVVRYESVSEEEAGPGATLGCGGTIDVLIEPVGANHPHDALSLLDHFWTNRRRGVITTVIAQRNSDLPVGTHFAFGDDSTLLNVGWESPTNSPNGGRCPPYAEIQSTLELNQSRPLRHTLANGWIDFFLELIHPPLELLIFGAGADAQPLAALATSLGWRVTVVDLRGSAAVTTRTFDADSVIRHAAADLEHLEIPPDASAVVMNHNWNHDQASLRRLIDAPLNYLGVLGPRRRTERLLSHLPDSSAAARHFCYPIGLDIGSETPQEVALAIVSEITALLRNAPGGHLRDKSGPIHVPTDPPCPLAAS